MKSTSSTSSSTVQPTSQHLWLGLASYSSLLCVIALLVQPNDPFVRFHVRQGFVLVMFELLSILCFFQPLLLWPGVILAALTATCSIVGLITVLQKKMMPIPGVAWFVRIFNV